MDIYVDNEGAGHLSGGDDNNAGVDNLNYNCLNSLAELHKNTRLLHADEDHFIHSVLQFGDIQLDLHRIHTIRYISK